MNHYTSDPTLAAEAPQASEGAPLDEAALRTAMTDALRSTAMLADVTIGTWSGERSDTQAMSTLAASAGAKGKVGRVIKNLMSGADARLKDTHSAFISVRTAHTMLTQPWVSNQQASRLSGPRLLPNALFEKYLSLLSTRRNAAMETLNVMLENYDADVEIAKANLGTLADAVYPTRDQVQAMFYIKIDFEPLPAASGFQNLPPQFAVKLAENLRKKQETMMEGAQGHLWQIARERITRMFDRMNRPEVMFKATTVEQLRDLGALMPAWNIVGDPRVTTVVDTIAAALDGVDADAIRKDDNLRARLAKDMRGLVDRLDEWQVGLAA